MLDWKNKIQTLLDSFLQKKCFFREKSNLQHSCEMKMIYFKCWYQSLNCWDTEGLLWNKDSEINSCLKRKANMLMFLPLALFPSCEGRTSCDGDSVTIVPFTSSWLTSLFLLIHPTSRPFHSYLHALLHCLSFRNVYNAWDSKEHPKDVNNEYETIDQINLSISLVQVISGYRIFF